MKNSLYKIFMFIFQIVNIILLLILCVRLNAFDIIAKINLPKILNTLFNNNYIINILCSIISIFILYFIQVNYSKHMIKKDFRCNEVIIDLYDGIEKTTELLELAKSIKSYNDIQEDKTQNNYIANRKIEAQSYYDFYTEHIHDFEFCNLILTYENNKILIDSIQTVFFINLRQYRTNKISK